MMGSFNFFRLAGDYTHLAALFTLLYGLWKSRNARTVSLRSQELYLGVYVMRYLDLMETGCNTSTHNLVFKVLFISITTACVILIRFYSKDTWPRELDSGRWHLVFIPAVIYGLCGTASHGLFRSPWNRFIWLELFWSISQGLEIFAIFPQGWLIYKRQNGQGYVVAWLALMFGYRLLYCLNWGYRNVTENKFDHMSIFSGGTQVTVFLAIFLYTITVNKRRIRLNPEDNDIEFAEFDPAHEEYAFLRASGGSAKGANIL
mmetsp:Transcript_34368/g.97350  ORF Transcript_34368/g.97350 Transcript_34368/m.97350 type:complete len:260 (+) Transcript_34368:653-1432(+)